MQIPVRRTCATQNVFVLPLNVTLPDGSMLEAHPNQLRQPTATAPLGREPHALYFYALGQMEPYVTPELYAG
ncbi:MAG: hypothetical protein AAFZ38_09960 [Myxococcota bacterium]